MNIEFEEDAKTLRDYMAIIKRRRVQFLTPLVVIFALAVLIVWSIPATYRSTATILIEEQEIPKDLVRSTITSYAAQQIHVITQRVMTVNNIHQVLDKYELYASDSDGTALSSARVAEKFRNNVSLDLVSADVIDPRSGRPTQATIAFTLAFDDGNPLTAQTITSELVSLYLDENLRARTDKASGAKRFLDAEAEALNLELREQEAVIAEFKQANEGALPELYQFNLNVVERTQRELTDIDLRLQGFRQRAIELESELSQISPSAPIYNDSGNTVLSDKERLRSLRAEYRTKTALYHDSHPDIKRLKREISALQRAGVDDSESRIEVQAQYARQLDLLAELRDRYTEDHPKVTGAKSVLSDLKAKLDASTPAPTESGLSASADNPAYVLLGAQLKSARIEIQSLNAKRNELQQKLQTYEGYIRKAPVVEKDYQALMRDYESTSEKYQDMKAKLRDAELSKSLEEDRKGGHFTLIEPADLPLIPVSPNRPALLLIGFFIAFFFGLGAVVLAEAMDHSVRSAKALAELTGSMPLVVIPDLNR